MAADGLEFTIKDVAAHKGAADAWMVIHGQVYDVSKYIHDHPGGSDILIEAAGLDATEPFDNAGHSEDALEIMTTYRVGKLKGGGKKQDTKPVRVTVPATPKSTGAQRPSIAPKALGAVVVALGTLGCYGVTAVFAPNLGALSSESLKTHRFGFFEGLLVASGAFAVAGSMLFQKLLKLLDFHADFTAYAPHAKLPKPIKSEPLLQRGWLHPTVYQPLPLSRKDLIAPNTYRLVFELPTPQTILGIPIGQHVTIAASVDGKTVSRSYTPVSNNADRGVLELVIKCYPEGLLTGGYLSKLEVGDEVQFRGPKGAMRYRPGMCKKIGMLAGGSGITPMYQLIRAICEDDRDTTEVSLIYANRTEGDILLRDELEAMARRYPKNLKIFYSLDQPPADWSYGSGYVTKEIMAERFPAAAPDSKIMICGPPGMVNAAKNSLASLGFERPTAISSMKDQVFCF